MPYKRRHRIFSLIISTLLLLAFSLVASHIDPTQITRAVTQNQQPSQNTSQAASLSRIIDGDTIVISTGEHVRLVGMNAPEHDTPQGSPATQHLHQLIDGKQIALIKDHSDKDKYGRLLRYVYVGSQNIDVQMVRDGWAKHLFIGPDTNFKSQILAAEQQAQAEHLGIWAQQ